MTDSPKSLSLASLLTQIKSCPSHLNVKVPWFMIQTILPFDSKLPFQLSLSLTTPASPSNQSSTFLSQCHLHQPMTFSVCSNSLSHYFLSQKSHFLLNLPLTFLLIFSRARSNSILSEKLLIAIALFSPFSVVPQWFSPLLVECLFILFMFFIIQLYNCFFTR